MGWAWASEHHILDTLSIRIHRCEDYTRVRKDRAYAFEARLSSLDGVGCFGPGGTDRELLRYSGAEVLELATGFWSPLSGRLSPPPTALFLKPSFRLTAVLKQFPVFGPLEPRRGLCSSRPRKPTTLCSPATSSLRSGQCSWRPRPASVARSRRFSPLAVRTRSARPVGSLTLLSFPNSVSPAGPLTGPQ